MFIITNRIRVLVALGAIGATVGSTAVASAAPVGHLPVTARPIVVEHPMVHVGPVQGAGSAGIAGYDDATCEGLARDNNTAVAAGNQAAQASDPGAAATNYNLANNIYNQMSDNCMVID